MCRRTYSISTEGSTPRCASTKSYVRGTDTSVNAVDCDPFTCGSASFDVAGNVLVDVTGSDLSLGELGGSVKAPCQFGFVRIHSVKGLTQS